MEITWTDTVFLTLCSLCTVVLWRFFGGSAGAPSHRYGRWRWTAMFQARFIAGQLSIFSAETVGGQEAEFIDDRPFDFSPAQPWIARGLVCLTYLSVLCLWYIAKTS